MTEKPNSYEESVKVLAVDYYLGLGGNHVGLSNLSVAHPGMASDVLKEMKTLSEPACGQYKTKVDYVKAEMAKGRRWNEVMND